MDPPTDSPHSQQLPRRFVDGPGIPASSSSTPSSQHVAAPIGIHPTSNDHHHHHRHQQSDEFGTSIKSYSYTDDSAKNRGIVLPQIQTYDNAAQRTNSASSFVSTSSYFSPTSSRAPYNEPSSVSSSYKSALPYGSYNSMSGFPAVHNSLQNPNGPIAEPRRESITNTNGADSNKNARMSLLTSKLNSLQQLPQPTPPQHSQHHPLPSSHAPAPQYHHHNQPSNAIPSFHSSATTAPVSIPSHSMTLPHPHNSLTRRTSLSYSSDPRHFSTSNQSFSNNMQHQFFPRPATSSVTTAVSTDSAHASLPRHGQIYDGGSSPMSTSPDQRPEPVEAKWRQQKLSSLPAPHASPATNMSTPPSRPDSVAQIQHLDIANHPVPDVIVMLTALLQKIIDANDALQPQGYLEPFDDAAAVAAASGNKFSANVLAFHGRNIPAISLHSYLSRILKYCPTTNEVFISLLVYFDRIAQQANQGERLTLSNGSSREDAKQQLFVMDSFNIHRLIIAGVTVSSKFFSDVFYKNSRYAKVGGLPVEELNHLELQFLLLTDFRLMVSVEEMQRYADLLLRFWQKEQQSTPTVATPNQAA